jgi:hypothetical protein
VPYFFTTGSKAPFCTYYPGSLIIISQYLMLRCLVMQQVIVCYEREGSGMHRSFSFVSKTSRKRIGIVRCTIIERNIESKSQSIYDSCAANLK